VNPTPLLTMRECRALEDARRAGLPRIECTLDLGLTRSVVAPGADCWTWDGRNFPYPERCRPRTIYYWAGSAYEQAAQYTTSLFKLVPTEWGAPTFEIDGIKMLPTARRSPYTDAEQKVGLIAPRGKTVLDTCGGLGYFAAWCLRGGAVRVLSFEKNASVLWLRTLNPWSPDSAWQPPPGAALQLVHGDIVEQIATLPDSSVDSILHDPPRISIAGELYSQALYDHLARVLRPGGLMFHYTGEPHGVSRGRALAREVIARLQRANFSAEVSGDGVLARAAARPRQR
jgi:predicted methyltransferase